VDGLHAELSRRACGLIPGRWTKRGARRNVVREAEGTASALSARLMAKPIRPLVGVSRDSMIGQQGMSVLLSRGFFCAM